VTTYWRALILVSLLAAGSGCRSQDEQQVDPLADVFHHQAQEEGLTSDETSGKRLFSQYCVTCHGDAGAGDGQNAYNLDPPPPDFHDSLKTHPSSYWRQIIEGGSIAVGRSAQCPPWGRSLARADIDTLVAYLQVLARPPAPSPAEGTSSPDAQPSP